MRHLCNQWMAVQAYAQMTQRKQSLDATYALDFLEGLHWHTSAALFEQADVVVSPHGAQVCLHAACCTASHARVQQAAHE